MTRFGLALEQPARLDDVEQAEIVQLAARLGYDSAWTPAPAALDRDAFLTCLRWWEASRKARQGGMTVGIAVVPLPLWSAPALAVAAATLASMTNGRLILGIGPSALHIRSFRARYGVPYISPVDLVRDHLITLRGLLGGETVTYRGGAVRLEGAALAFSVPPVPLFISALGPRMLALAGELADGVCLNWCTTAQIDASRAAVAAAAAGAGRDRAAIQLSQSIRVSLDPDPDVARRRLAAAILPYALARPGSSSNTGYRGHFARMGFDDALRQLERARSEGATDAHLADAFPVEILGRVAYFGEPAGATAGIARLAAHLDLALIRPVTPVGDARAVADVLTACAPLVAKDVVA